MNSKICTECHVSKPYTAFRKKNRGQQTHENICKACQNAKEALERHKSFIYF